MANLLSDYIKPELNTIESQEFDDSPPQPLKEEHSPVFKAVKMHEVPLVVQSLFVEEQL